MSFTLITSLPPLAHLTPEWALIPHIQPVMGQINSSQCSYHYLRTRHSEEGYCALCNERFSNLRDRDRVSAYDAWHLTTDNKPALISLKTSSRNLVHATTARQRQIRARLKLLALKSPNSRDYLCSKPIRYTNASNALGSSIQ